MVNNEVVQQRKEAFAWTETYVKPLCETYPPKQYINQTGPATIISSSGSYVVPAAEQAIDLMIKLADWLLYEEKS